MTTIIEELTQQLQSQYISEYANGQPTLLFNQQPAYHFRLNLSYYFPEVISSALLKKTEGVAQHLIQAIFNEAEEIFVFEYLFDKKQLRKWLPAAKRTGEKFVPLSFTTDNLRITSFQLTAPPVLLYKLARGLIYQDFKNFDATVLHLDNPVILFQPVKKILLHIYDDRGCDVFCQNEADYQALLAEFSAYINSYTKLMRANGYQVVETDHGLYFR